ncbi:sensor histidine kinase [Paracoccus methylarcula]|uniref:C4-dicarboxylate transport sensor protein DctB n=1 Tax=Paracoccus methylarcula TaxID=72022 RepID=A0A3R7SD87_9RHOB|nr:ATP-binding protein [Paracoccus methylarcula]RNF35243.1 sensor histidine kinase [Paracoccus methylarcula]
MTRSSPQLADDTLESRKGGLGRILPLCGVLALCIALPGFGIGPLTNYYLSESKARGDSTMKLAVATLDGELARYERLPQLLAQQPILREVISYPDDQGIARAANAYLKDVNALLESSDLYVMRPDGLTVAASNYDSDMPFIGQNFSYRPYFDDALAGGLGRFFGLGTTSYRRGYYFAAPIRENGKVIGVVTQKIDLAQLEDSWRASGYEIIVTDPEGVIFLSTRANWTYYSLAPLSASMLRRSRETQRYARTEIGTLPLEEAGDANGHPLVTIDENGRTRTFMMIGQEMPEAGWTVRVLVDTASARRQAWAMALIAMLAIVVATLAAAILVQRRNRGRERAAYQRATQALLERRVAERTAELGSVNQQLKGEVEERRAAEMELRRTQRRLVQSAKLAAIGQMSAALSHEFNQPLGAVRNFADNAETYMQRQRYDEARKNIVRIQGLADRMAEISRTLRNFARKPRQRLEPVELSGLVRDSVEVISWRLKGSPAKISVDDIPDGLAVVAEPVRLQQVLVNLMANALDALDGLEDPQIGITVKCEGKAVTLTVADNGPGIPAELQERIFDPFFSTKGVGQGLGLGLSISYNIIRDFGGELRLCDAPGGGAIFHIELPAPPVGEDEAAA